MIGKLSTIMLVVGEMERSVRFYRDVLGVQVRFESPHWSTLDAGTIDIGLHPEGGNLRVSPGPGCTFGFDVGDIETTVAELKAKGVDVVAEPVKQDFGGWLAVIADPDGYQVQLHQPGS